MALIDVSEILGDPDFCTFFAVTRNTQSAPVGGITVTTPTVFASVVGVVEPATSNDLMRLVDAERGTGSIAIYTKFRIDTADIVTWNGRQYTVMTSDDWSQYGAGYIRALATMLSLG